MKKILALLLIAGVGLVVARKTHFSSYVSTCVAQVGDEFKQSVPTKFELERIRHEIGRLDKDISRMIRPVAEYKTEIDWLRKDIQKTQANLDERRTALLEMTDRLNRNTATVLFGDREYKAESFRQKLQREFNNFKRLEANLATKQKLFEAKEASLQAAQDQLAKVIEKKREFELRVAQLEAENETLQVARIGSKLEIDDSRATQIEAALTEAQKRLDTDRNHLALEAGSLTTASPAQQRTVNVNAIREYLQQDAAEQTETARNNK
jgi:chromosome segregation ATPase